MVRRSHTAILIAVVIMIAIAPVVLLGPGFEESVREWFTPLPSGGRLAVMVVAVLAMDVFLPVPSSVVSTLAGAQLGIVAGTAASWLGMTLGAVIAFAIARLGGRPLAGRLSAEETLTALDELVRGYRTALVVLFRPLPILAEASVLLVGTTSMTWGAFLLSVSASNVAVSLPYAFFGYLARDSGWLPAVTVLVLSVPLLLALLIRHRILKPANEC